MKKPNKHHKKKKKNALPRFLKERRKGSDYSLPLVRWKERGEEENEVQEKKTGPLDPCLLTLARGEERKGGGKKKKKRKKETVPLCNPSRIGKRERKKRER